MKLTVFLSLLSIMQVFASGSYSQNTKLTFDFEDVTVKDVLVQIEDMSEFYFLYSTKIIDVNREISISVNKEKISGILDKIFPDDNVDYIVKGRQIVLTSNDLADSFRGIDQQQKSISGKVTDENGEPLPGVTVLIKGTTLGMVCDTDGNYTILNIPEDATLQFSFIGMQTQEIVVGDQTTINVTMLVDAIGLEEVVAIGYGSARRKDISGAVSSIKLEDSPLGLAPNSNVMQALRGSTPGVNIGAQTRVGQTPEILIRGQNSISGNNAPSIVLDGVIYLGELSDINPSDIASIDILKDASAAAAYGSRSGNGVILISSKKGRTEKPLIMYSTSAGVNVWQDKPNLMEIPEYLEKVAIQTGVPVEDLGEGGTFASHLIKQRVNTNWLDIIGQTGTTQKHNLSVSGRSDKMNYFFSGGYEKQNGIVIGDQFRRISMRSRLSVDVTDWLEVGVDGSYNNNDYSKKVAQIRLGTIMAPYGTPYRYEGMPYNYSENTSTDLERYPLGESIPNPLWGTGDTRDAINRIDAFRFSANALFKVPGVEGLTYRLNYSLNGSYERDHFIEKENHFIQEAGSEPYFDRYLPAEIQKGLSSARGKNVRYRSHNYVIDNIINYKRDFGKHYVDLTVVAARDFSSITKSTLAASNFSSAGNTILGFNGLFLADNQINSLDIIERSNVGYLGRVGYAFDSKYHLNASYRRDGASVFGADNKYGNFYSIGGAWTVTEEDFLNDSKTLNYLKVKVSHGVNGSQGIKPYETLAQITSGPGNLTNYAYGDNPSQLLFGIYQSSLGNENIGWEETTATNVGFQSVWLNNRVFFDLDVYFSKTTDQIFKRNIPIYSGFKTVFSSLGQIDNSGLEISLRTINVENDNLTWNTSLNFWLNRSKIASLYGDDSDGDGIEDDDIANSYFIGKSLGAIYGYDFIGVVQESNTEYIANNGAEPGDPMFRDIDGVDGISPDDRKILGYNTPNFRMSLGNTLTYKNFTFYAMITGVFGGGSYYQGSNPSATSFNAYNGYYNELDHPWWTPENKSNTYLRPGYLGTRYLGLQSRGFVRLQDISVSYKMPQRTLDAIGIGLNSVELFVTGNNVHTFTNWTGGDPEAGVRPFSGQFPVVSTYSLGLNISF